MSGAPDVGLLLLVHGERREGAGNAAALRLASDLRARRVAAQVEIGFLSGTPGIAQALGRLAGLEVLVYPLFMTDGYFLGIARDQLRRVAEAGGAGLRTLTMLPALGLDPALADVIAGRAAAAAEAAGFDPRRTGVVLVAHGSARERASSAATEALAGRLRARRRLGDVATAYLEQAPSLAEALSGLNGPAVIVGLFTGDGLHGLLDLSRTIGDLGRPETLFAGNVGTWPEIAELVVAGLPARTRGT